MKDDFYVKTVSWLIEQGILDCQMRLLVVCGGSADREVLQSLRFTNVVISNLDVRLRGDEFAPFEWSFQDAEKITFGNEEFDFCIAHNGLHHCYSPHRALLEMYRVSRKGLLVFEPRDSLLTRIWIRLNFSQEYEVAAVVGNGYAFGGVRNTSLPNFVYRWTEREIEKTVCSNAPWGTHRFLYRYALRIPWGRLNMLKNKSFLRLIQTLLPLVRFFFWLFPRQANGFAFVVQKSRIPEDLHSWVRVEKGEMTVDKEWARERYLAVEQRSKS